ncbi:MAG: hypothetical protein J5I81_12160 [Nitrococcus mobilis]|nr:hypothetical protein [Nitrococcus mobilis]
MRRFAEFIMRGRGSAVLVIFVSAMVPLLLWVSGGALSLVTLRRGAAEGAFAAGVATLVLLVAVGALAGSPQPALQPILQLWLPVFLIALWLRYSVSLAQALEVAAGLTALAVAVFHFLHPDTVGYWREVFAQARALFPASSQLDPKAWEDVVTVLAPEMTGLWAVNLLGLAVGSLLLGRWWQAMLYNPGGFRAEFHALRLERWFAWLVLAWLVAAAALGHGLVYDIAFALSAVFVLQALAVLHALLAGQRWGKVWLGLVYFFLFLPLILQLVAVVGIIDVFLDMRRRRQGLPGQGGSP